MTCSKGPVTDSDRVGVLTTEATHCLLNVRDQRWEKERKISTRSPQSTSTSFVQVIFVILVLLRTDSVQETKAGWEKVPNHLQCHKRKSHAHADWIFTVPFPRFCTRVKKICKKKKKLNETTDEIILKG